MVLLALLASPRADAAASTPSDPWLTSTNRSPRNSAAAASSQASTWVSIGGFLHASPYGSVQEGALLTVGVAFDRIAAGPVHRVSERPALMVDTSPEAGDSGEPDAAAAPRQPKLSPRVARLAVKAAWRASGLGTDDTRIDAIIARSRASAGLPELRLRAMRVLTDSAKQDTTTAASDGLYYQTLGSGLTLEARMTWRLDRLLFADDEPTMERVRLERLDARQKLATRVLEALFQWQRAAVDSELGMRGSRERLEAEARVAETSAILDVLTAGWFTAFLHEQGLPAHQGEGGMLPTKESDGVRASH